MLTIRNKTMSAVDALASFPEMYCGLAEQNNKGNLPDYYEEYLSEDDFPSELDELTENMYFEQYAILSRLEAKKAKKNQPRSSESKEHLEHREAEVQTEDEDPEILSTMMYITSFIELAYFMYLGLTWSLNMG
ncbi:protein ORF10B [Cyprinid herpesvirus 1]|uniref:Protein ORF10B n=1 Tax=Cyprinid herpesvirus 1 TaxID=317858 RepID=K7PC48_9VIRU|nr:protein ORF10B [Cyprinid herpesvirus 1]AFJ20322.1 protein ORF10B [Cyprinid herpesvirus 1]